MKSVVALEIAVPQEELAELFADPSKNPLVDAWLEGIDGWAEGSPETRFGRPPRLAAGGPARRSAANPYPGNADREARSGVSPDQAQPHAQRSSGVD